MFSCEFCEMSKNTFSYRTPPVAASEVPIDFFKNSSIIKYSEVNHVSLLILTF